MCTSLIGLLDQWLIEGKFTEEEALSQSYDMLSAGIDMVRLMPTCIPGQLKLLFIFRLV